MDFSDNKVGFPTNSLNDNTGYVLRESEKSFMVFCGFSMNHERFPYKRFEQ